jgi:conjugal transfer pilus assembly protein TraA
MKIDTSNLRAILKREQVQNALGLTLMVGSTAAVMAGMAHAGTDTTFTTTVTNLTNYTNGSLGKLAAIGSLAFGIIGAVARFDWKLIAGGVGLGLAAATGPAIVTGLATATF